MDVYNYSPVNGEYLGTSKADESPLEPGVFLIPAHATTTEPPQRGEREVAVFSDGSWSIAPDWRGRQFWLPDGSEHRIAAIGDEPPPGALDAPPPPTEAQVREQAKFQRAEQVAAITVTTQAGHTFDGDETSQTRMSRAIIALGAVGPSATVNWVLADNSVIDATAAELTEALALAGAAQAALWVLP